MGRTSYICRTDPSDGKFFVAKKGIFNKNPKVYKTQEDIKQDTDGDLKDKLSLALNLLQADYKRCYSRLIFYSLKKI